MTDSDNLATWAVFSFSIIVGTSDSVARGFVDYTLSERHAELARCRRFATVRRKTESRL